MWLLTEIVIVVIAVVVFLAFSAFADDVTEKDREEDDRHNSDPPS